MTCENWQDLILDREHLNDAQRQELDQHLSNCVACEVWAAALAEVDSQGREVFQAEIDPMTFQARVLRSLARYRRRSWMTSVAELLDALGWTAIGLLGMVGLLVWTNRANWLGNHLVWMGSAALVGGVAWAAVVLWKEESGPRLLL
jgi:predicted anti-sigma-YlaC factor YlaD